MKFTSLGIAIATLALLINNPTYGQTDTTPASTASGTTGQTQDASSKSQSTSTVKTYAESPQAFLQRFIEAKARAKSPLDLKEFFVPGKYKEPDTKGLTEAQIKQGYAIMEKFFEADKLYTPSRIVVIGTQKQNNDLLIMTKIREAKTFLNKSETYDISGKYLLRKGATTWQIVSEVSELNDGKGMKTSMGNSTASKPEPSTPKSVYEKSVSKAFEEVWKPSKTTSGAVTIELQNTSNGTYRIINITDKNGSASAEAEAKAMLSNLRMPPLPSNIDTPIVNIQWIWSPDQLPLQVLQYSKSSYTVPQPKLTASTGLPTTTIGWVNDGKNDAFKQQPFGGNLEGRAVKFTKAQIRTIQGGWELEFKPFEGKDYPCVKLMLYTKEDVQGKTFFIPLPEVDGRFGKEPSSYFERHTGQSSCGTSEGFAGRIQFGKWNKGLLSGYLTLRIGSSNIKSSAINGFFYAAKEAK